MKCFLSITLFNLLFSIGFAQNTLTAHLSVPKQIEEKQTFTEYLNIEKPANLRSYAVFTQQFPDGFYIETKTVQGASISFENNILTVTWMRLPPDRSVRVPVKISFIRGLTGTFALSGKLTYIIDNKRGEFDLNKEYFSIVSGNTGSEDLDEYTNQYTAFQNIECLRKIKHNNDGTYSIELKINNISDIDEFILTEEVSQGFEILKDVNTELTPDRRIAQFEIKNTEKKK